MCFVSLDAQLGLQKQPSVQPSSYSNVLISLGVEDVSVLGQFGMIWVFFATSYRSDEHPITVPLSVLETCIIIGLLKS